MSLTLEIVGLDGLMKAVHPSVFHKPVRGMFQRMAIFAQGVARKKVVVDTGRLRSSIAYGVDPINPAMYAKVNTEVFYAPYVEYGTGTMSDGEGGTGRAHYPPGEALQTWAVRHGFKSGYAVAAIIGRRGGLRPKPFMRPALEATRARLGDFIRRCEQEIEQEFDRRFKSAANSVRKLL